MLKIGRVDPNAEYIPGWLTRGPMCSDDVCKSIRFFPSEPVRGTNSQNEESWVMRSPNWSWTEAEFLDTFGMACPVDIDSKMQIELQLLPTSD